MTIDASLHIDPRRRLGCVDERIYGQFTEHVGRVVYGGVFEPGSVRADDDGYRLDVLELASGLRPTVLRWPGGNFASGYHWLDGVGQASERPTRHDLAWDAVESNLFGTEEFLELARRLGAEPYLNLNASSGTIDEAQAWVEYCNASRPLPEVRRRESGPHPDPHHVRIWGLGNENYGWWQHGHTTAPAYAELAREWGKLLRWADPAIELVAVGAPDPDWNWTVLTTAGHSIDYLSLHFYWHGDLADRYHSMLAGPIASERVIEGTWGLVLEARRKLGIGRPIRLAVDEWGVWETTHRPLAENAAKPDDFVRGGLSARMGIDTRFEEVYDLKDALAVATWLHVMWRHPSKLGLATMAQMVNAIAPILASPDAAYRQTVYYPVAIARAHALPVALDVLVDCSGGVVSPGVPEGSLAAVDAAATLDPSTGHVHVSVINRDLNDSVTLMLEGVEGEARLVQLYHEDPFAQNTFAAPDTIAPDERRLRVSGPLELPPHSHTTLVFGE